MLILNNVVTAEGAMTNAPLVHLVDSSVAVSCQRMSIRVSDVSENAQPMRGA
jgi:hypothetical protein